MRWETACSLRAFNTPFDSHGLGGSPAGPDVRPAHRASVNRVAMLGRVGRTLRRVAARCHRLF
ncbi:MAG: hypothetical protein K6T75_10260 [Acetobacteraceae bacterium]|nr:hypothetical protein [Acetobacteraceae bacterium]